MKVFLSIICVLLFNFFAVAQSQKDPPLSLTGKMALLSVFDPNGPTLQPGLEINWKKRWGLHAEYGFSSDPFSVISKSRKTEVHTQKLRTELRYYQLPGITIDYSGLLFYAAEYFSVRQNYNRINGRFQHPDTKEELWYDTARVSRNVLGFNLKAGYVFFTGNNKRFSIEVAGGIGLRNITIKHTEIAALQQGNGGIVGAIVDAFRIRANDEFEGTKSKPNLSFNVGAAYRLF